MPVDEAYTAQLIQISDSIYLIGTIVSLFIVFFFRKKRDIIELIGIILMNMLPKERKYWGKVYDTNNGNAIPYALVYLLHNNTVIERTVTDSDGRYRLTTQKLQDNYRIEVLAEGFKKHVQSIRSLDTSKQIVEDIPLIQTEVSGNILRQLYYKYRTKLYGNARYIIFILSVLNLVLGAFSTLNNPAIINVIAFSVFNIVVYWNYKEVKGRLAPDKGRVISSKNQKSLPNVRVDVFYNSLHIAQDISDSQGVVHFDLPPGYYNFKLFYTIDGENKESPLVSNYINKNGYLRSNIEIDIDPTKQVFQANPFGD